MIKDTIAAIACGMGNSGIGIVRISGNEAIEIVDKLFVGKSGKKLSESKSYRAHYGHIVYDNKVIDEVIVLVMKAPNTYTREDVVEIDCHGGVYVVQKILELVLRCGARPAEPGEFTKRAFLNGRIDLAQAEAVIDIINSKNEYALRSSVNTLNGKLSSSIKKIREDILYNVAYIESALDDPEHSNLDNFGDNLKVIVDNMLFVVDKLLKTVDNGKFFSEGVHTVILGKPNAGKSSLLNILVGEEKAIVTDIAGTTRDALEEQINLNGVLLNLVDTAGIRQTEDVVERIGVQRAKEYALSSDLIIYVVDSSTELDENDKEIFNLIKDKKVIVLLNKSDLSAVTSEDDVKEFIDCPILSVSAKSGIGIEELENTVVGMFIEGDVNYNDEVLITRARQKDSLYNARESLILVKKSIEDSMPEDFYTIDLMNAYEELGKIIGETVEDDLVNEIFSKFCMGK